MDKVTSQGRKINGMTKNDIIEYLGITDNEDKNYKNELLGQAEEIEKQYTGKDVDYCIKADFYSYMLDTNKKPLGKTKDLIIYN